MYLSILMLPLLGSVVSGLLGRKIGVTGSHIVTITCLIITSILSIIAFYEVGVCDSPVSIHITSWVNSEFLNISWGFLFDSLTVSMLIPVLFISTLVHLYSTNYMAEDPAKCFGTTFFGFKLPNSGDNLKLMVPSYSRKVISGWSNDSGTVTSHKMIENEMGYRGSKSSVFKLNNPLIATGVKEQRVDGNWCINPKLMHLRCTLMGFERNYQIKIPSKQLNVKNFSTFNNSSQIKPWFLTGFIDAEGSFSIIIDRNKARNLDWRVQAKFQLGLHKRDLSLLLQLQQFLGGIGSIHINPILNKVNYSIDSNKHLMKLVTHLDKYPLLTQKANDFKMFKEVVILMSNKAHLSIGGLNQIINLKASMNLGLSDLLKLEFKDFSSIEKQIINTNNIPDPNWISGFVTGEGNFDVLVTRQSSNKIGSRVQLRFRISQHARDIRLMEYLIKYLGSGKIYKYSEKPAVVLTIFKFSDINNKIIPFFEQNPLLGVKLFDYLDWCKVAKLMNNGSHLTQEGLNKILDIKSRMNTGRDSTNI